MPGPPKITLDQESFRALASEVRVNILKKLDERRQTVTDLSNLLELSKPTLLEHLEKLQAAGLVKRMDEGRKWIYYELTEKGRNILRPERVAIVIALGNTIGLIVIGLIAILASTGMFIPPSPAGTNPAMNPVATPPQSPLAIQDPATFLWMALLAFGLAAGSIVLAYLLRRVQRRRTAELFALVPVD